MKSKTVTQINSKLSKYGDLENKWENASPIKTDEKKDEGSEAGVKLSPQKKEKKSASKGVPSIPTQVITDMTLDCVYFANEEDSFEHEKEKLSDKDPGLGIINELESKSAKVLAIEFHPEESWICVSLENGIIQM